MYYEISVSEEKKYILIKVHGNFDAAETMRENIKAHELAKEHGISRFLMDLSDSSNTAMPMEQYKFAYEDMKNAEEINPYAKIAFFSGKRTPNENFLMAVLKNSGAIVEMFPGREEAEAWLLE